MIRSISLSFSRHMKETVLIIVLFIFISCSSTPRIEEYTPVSSKTEHSEIKTSAVPKTTIVKTANPNLKYPFLHKNGFKDYEIVKSKYIKTSDSHYANELRFNATYSSFYTKKLMYDHFGNWNKNLFLSNGRRKNMLIWENVKLFDDNDQLFYVAAGGFENTDSVSEEYPVYSSVIVLDSNRNDCLSDKNIELKESIITFFSNGINNLNSDKEFYDKYWKMVLN